MWGTGASEAKNKREEKTKNSQTRTTGSGCLGEGEREERKGEDRGRIDGDGERPDLRRWTHNHAVPRGCVVNWAPETCMIC